MQGWGRPERRGHILEEGRKKAGVGDSHMAHLEERCAVTNSQRHKVAGYFETQG